MNWIQYFLHHLTYYKFRQLFFTHGFFEYKKNPNGQDDYIIKEINNKLHLGIKVNDCLCIYVIPSEGYGDYRVMFLIGEVDYETAPVVLFELNLNASKGNIIGFPQSLEDNTSNQDLFYSCELPRSVLISRKKLKKFISEIEHESAYKLNTSASNAINMLYDNEAKNEEWLINNEEDGNSI